jgi:hypothetical protein
VVKGNFCWRKCGICNGTILFFHYLGGFCSALNFEKLTSSMTGTSSGNGDIHNWFIYVGGTCSPKLSGQNLC